MNHRIKHLKTNSTILAFYDSLVKKIIIKSRLLLTVVSLPLQYLHAFTKEILNRKMLFLRREQKYTYQIIMHQNEVFH